MADARKNKIIIGTRGSKLALCQAEWVKQQLSRFTSRSIDIKKIKTTGDKLLTASLVKSGDKGLFVKEIENALQSGEIDLAVHSLKDLPVEIPQDLTISAVPKRVDTHDALISRDNFDIDKLPSNAVIGTSSLRRKAQVLNYRHDLKMLDVRGNLDTRIRKMREGECDAIIVAAAGLIRLGWKNKITQMIPWKICLPAVGQGALAIETRKGDESIIRLVKKLDHKKSHLAVFAERSLLKSLGGGCQVPLGVLSELKNGQLILEGIITNLTGTSLIRSSVSGAAENAEAIGARLAKQLLDKGARKILDSL